MAAAAATNSGLFEAIVDGRSSLVAEKLKAGVAINEFLRDGWTPLTLAAQHSKNSVDIVRVIVESGAALDAHDKTSGTLKGKTALITAAFQGFNAVLDYLLDKVGWFAIALTFFTSVCLSYESDISRQSAALRRTMLLRMLFL